MSDKQSIAHALRELTKKSQGRSATARLREVIDEVEAALNAGVKREAIVAELVQQGLTLTLSGFDSALFRLRKERGNNAASASSETAGIAHTTISGTDGMPTDTIPPGHPPELEAQLVDLTTKQRRERIGHFYVKEPLHPALKQLLEK